MRLILIRHGESRHNAVRDGVVIGEDEGDRLTERGSEQAREVAASLRGSGAAALISSGMRRARQTAEVISAELGLPVELDDGIHELHEGHEFATLPPEEQRLRRWSVWMAEHADDPGWAPPGGESFSALAARVRDFKQRARARCEEAEGPVAVVTHGIFLRFFLIDSLLGREFRAAEIDRLWQMRTRNCGVSVFDWRQGGDPVDPGPTGWTCSTWMAPRWAER